MFFKLNLTKELKKSIILYLIINRKLSFQWLKQYKIDFSYFLSDHQIGIKLIENDLIVA